MTRLLIWVFVLFFCGCTNTAIIQESEALQHENNEDRLLTKEEFFSRVSQSADLIYEGLRAIRDAVRLYSNDNNGELPSGSNQVLRALFLEEGYLEEWPVVPVFAFTDPVQKDFRYYSIFGDTDNNGVRDDVIILQDLKIEVCQDFVRRYASPGFGDKVYDFEAANDRYPAETIGRHIKIFAVNWSMATTPDSCDILWIVQYEGFPEE
jgi:hypothetical protein